MRVLITGITGFAGSHLAEYILGLKNHEVYGSFRWRSNKTYISTILDKITLVECDLRDAFSTEKLIADVKPDLIFHLAAQSFVPFSFDAPGESLQTNILGQLNLFEAVRKSNYNPRILIAGSSEEYGMVFPDEIPIKETNPLRPLSPYAVSKVTQDLLAYQYYESYGIRVVRSRGFNHTGPRRGPVFICSNFAKQIVDIENGRCEPIIRVGNLEAKRDFTDVRDMVKGYWLALQHCKDGECYNICSNHTISMKEILHKLVDKTDKKVRVEVDESRLRPSDVPILLGDYSKFNACTGWKPTIDFDTTLSDILEYWRNSPGVV